jgi:hypothetical protein
MTEKTLAQMIDELHVAVEPFKIPTHNPYLDIPDAWNTKDAAKAVDEAVKQIVCIMKPVFDEMESNLTKTICQLGHSLDWAMQPVHSAIAELPKIQSLQSFQAIGVAVKELLDDPTVRRIALIGRLNRFMPYRLAWFIGYRWPERWLK